MNMGQAISFCPPDARRDEAIGRNSSDNGNADNALVTANTLASRHNNLLLVIADSSEDNSPIKNRAEYAKSPTVADRIELQVEEELRRRREEETTCNEEHKVEKKEAERWRRMIPARWIKNENGST